MGYISEFFIWNELADATKLNYEERDKWIKNYTPTPTPGMRFEVPNTLVIYSTELSGLDNSLYHPLLTAMLEKNVAIRKRFDKAGVNIIEHAKKEDRQLFLDSWKTEGILGIVFSGHGMDNGEKNQWKGGGFCTTNNNSDMPVTPSEVTPPYQLAFIAAFCCGAKEVGWGNKGKGALLSENGSYIGYWGIFDTIDDNGGYINFCIKVACDTGGCETHMLHPLQAIHRF